MMKSIGVSKVILILALCAFGVLAFFYNKQTLEPDLKKQKRQLSADRGEVARMKDDLFKLTDGLEKFESQKADFENIRQLGFFDQQNRVQARQRIKEVQKESRLISARYAIKPAQTIGNKKAGDAGYKILSTDIDFNLEAIEDADIYRFIYILNYGFPGQVFIKNFSISREREVTQPLLRKIGVGGTEAIIKANLNISWQTIVPDETISVTAEQGGMQ